MIIFAATIQKSLI
jgi:hypothetical protein